VPLKRGRWLEPGDARPGTPIVVINETAARQLWLGQPAVGKRLAVTDRNPSRPEQICEVVGVVGDTHDYGRHATPQPTFYRPLQKEAGVDVAPKFLVVRSAAEPALLYRSISQALRAAGSDVRMPEFVNLHDRLWRQMAAHRALMVSLAIFAAVGLFLAALGLYGMLAHSVTRRTREIGIRIAVGARKSDVVRLVLRQGLTLTALGAVLGAAGGLLATRALGAYLFGVGRADPWTLLAVVLLLGTVALVACWLPARTACRVDPLRALKID
jgi:putative ABC transport system permease protein